MRSGQTKMKKEMHLVRKLKWKLKQMRLEDKGMLKSAKAGRRTFAQRLKTALNLKGKKIADSILVVEKIAEHSKGKEKKMLERVLSRLTEIKASMTQCMKDHTTWNRADNNPCLPGAKDKDFGREERQTLKNLKGNIKDMSKTFTKVIKGTQEKKMKREEHIMIKAVKGREHKMNEALQSKAAALARMEGDNRFQNFNQKNEEEKAAAASKGKGSTKEEATGPRRRKQSKKVSKTATKKASKKLKKSKSKNDSKVMKEIKSQSADDDMVEEREQNDDKETDMDADDEDDDPTWDTQFDSSWVQQDDSSKPVSNTASKPVHNTALLPEDGLHKDSPEALHDNNDDAW